MSWFRIFTVGLLLFHVSWVTASGSSRLELLEENTSNATDTPSGSEDASASPTESYSMGNISSPLLPKAPARDPSPTPTPDVVVRRLLADLLPQWAFILILTVASAIFCTILVLCSVCFLLRFPSTTMTLHPPRLQHSTEKDSDEECGEYAGPIIDKSLRAPADVNPFGDVSGPYDQRWANAIGAIESAGQIAAVRSGRSSLNRSYRARRRRYSSASPSTSPSTGEGTSDDPSSASPSPEVMINTRIGKSMDNKTATDHSLETKSPFYTDLQQFGTHNRHNADGVQGHTASGSDPANVHLLMNDLDLVEAAVLLGSAKHMTDDEKRALSLAAVTLMDASASRMKKKKKNAKKRRRPHGPFSESYGLQDPLPLQPDRKRMAPLAAAAVASGDPFIVLPGMAPVYVLPQQGASNRAPTAYPVWFPESS